MKPIKSNLLIELSGEHPKLPLAELENVLNALGQNKKNKLLSVNINKVNERLAIVHLETETTPNKLLDKLYNRLAMAHNINELLAFGDGVDIECALENSNYKPLPRDSTFKLLTRSLAQTNKESWSKNEIIALKSKIVHNLSKTACVDVKRPDYEIVLYRDTKLYLAKRRYYIPRTAFEKRRPHHRPYFAPVSVHPRLARCLVNLAGLYEDQVLLDPFCGTGGILIEAGLMGLSIIGSDVDIQMVDGTRTNLKHFGIKGFRLIHASIEELPKYIFSKTSEKQFKSTSSSSSSTTTSLAPTAIVTEPPYGRASTISGFELDDLMQKAFDIFSEILPVTGRVVISLPNPKLVMKINRDFKLLNMYEVRVHKSLTKNVYVFEFMN